MGAPLHRRFPQQWRLLKQKPLNAVRQRQSHRTGVDPVQRWPASQMSVTDNLHVNIQIEIDQD